MQQTCFIEESISTIHEDLSTTKDYSVQQQQPPTPIEDQIPLVFDFITQNEQQQPLTQIEEQQFDVNNYLAEQ